MTTNGFKLKTTPASDKLPEQRTRVVFVLASYKTPDTVTINTAIEGEPYLECELNQVEFTAKQLTIETIEYTNERLKFKRIFLEGKYFKSYDLKLLTLDSDSFVTTSKPVLNYGVPAVGEHPTLFIDFAITLSQTSKLVDYLTQCGHFMEDVEVWGE